MKAILIKCGGSILDELSAEFFTSLHELKKQNHQVIIVHGGGPDINQMLEQLNVKAEYVNGLRKTNEETLKVVEMVLSGQTNRKLVQKLSENGLQAIGLNGSDAGILTAEYVDKDQLGFVGDIIEVNVELLKLLLQQDIIPVLTPIAACADGTKLNVNADYAAAAVAKALRVEQCLFVTDVEGILINGMVQDSIHIVEIESYIKKGDIYGGMIPKVTSAISAIKKGTKSVRIVAGKKSFYLNNEWYGTKIL
ncbi:acetylglutamate kinase [Robertmurraya kyonggiensis]|uniref:Acetylglutamate kinase n=1 Tax=Robertmurraya kyonggiensis TaxID=1037680 RepID=A0A4V6WND5_9BACI|nr:acetylglutamate kinase [Robertmurraya kyonggiensis]TKC18260.1 acetylglutamate kinase [Robertmurraya kyonggiensis]